jgi:hypothetical protein
VIDDRAGDTTFVPAELIVRVRQVGWERGLVFGFERQVIIGTGPVWRPG